MIVGFHEIFKLENIEVTKRANYVANFLVIEHFRAPISTHTEYSTNVANFFFFFQPC